MLRAAFGRAGWSCGRRFAGSAAGSIGAGEASSSPSGSCAASVSNFSERAPYSARFKVSNIARILAFSSRNSTIIPIRISGSRGSEATSDTMRR
jgi:hypothetical protein